MGNLINTLKVRSRIDQVDIIFIFFNLLIWIFIVNAWKDPIANAMLSISVFILSTYFLARFTGIFGFLEITKPFWTISAILSILVWNVVFKFIPAIKSSVTAPSEAISRNMLETFVSASTSTSFLQIFMFPLIESLLIAVIVSFFVGFSRTGRGFSGLALFGAILLTSVFGALIHIAVAVKLAEAGVVTQNVLFGHQFLSFFIFTGMGILFFGTPGIIASHIIKNALVFASVNLWYIIFAFFILMDILSIISARQKEKRGYMQTVGRLNFIK